MLIKLAILLTPEPRVTNRFIVNCEFRAVLISKIHKIILLTAICCCSAEAGSLDNTIWQQIGQQKGVSPYLLYAIALKESRITIAHHQVTPYPWTVRTRTGGHYYSSFTQAKTALNRAILTNKLVYIDVGIMQINLHYNRHRVKKPIDLLKPATSIAIAADILSESLARYPNNPALGVGHYNSSDRSKAIAYGNDVLRIANNLKKLKF